MKRQIRLNLGRAQFNFQSKQRLRQLLQKLTHEVVSAQVECHWHH